MTAPDKPTRNPNDTLLEQITDGTAPDSTDSDVRYLAYGSRIRTLLATAHRYVAYTSDIGESFRPVAHPYLVRGAYGISWAYLLGDVANEGYKAYTAQAGARVPPAEDYRTTVAKRALFQSVASMGLPALTIHSVVKYAGVGMRGVRNVKVRTWAPIGLGLAVVPALPFMFDEPVERAVEWVFEKGFEMGGGKEKEL